MKLHALLGCLLLIVCGSLLPYEMFDLNNPSASLNIIKKYVPSDPFIFEAGACHGTETVEFKKHWPGATVFSFEPVPSLFAEVVQRTAGYDHIHLFPVAISDKVGLSQFHLSSFEWSPNQVSESSSLLAPKDHLAKAPFVQFGSTMRVPTTTIDIWAAQNKVDHIDLMWLDMQGYELPALKSALTILKTVKVILTEVEFVEAYKGQALFPEVKAWLESQGFEMIAHDFDMKKSDWFGDALFVRKELVFSAQESK